VASGGSEPRAGAARAGWPRLRRFVVFLVALAGLMAACSGVTIQPAGGGGNGGGGGGGATYSGDVCKLLTSDEVKQVVGYAVTQVEPASHGCNWHFLASMGISSFGIDYYVTVEVTSPGGRDDFQSTRDVSKLFGGAFASLGAAAATMAAPIDSNLSGNVGGLFQVQDIPGLGDAAFQGAGQVVYVLKGDTEISVQLVDVTDSNIVDKAISLAKIIIGRV